ncbi:MAG: cytochrome c family protein [Hyphomonadaceae bacterium]|nr:cytochrome c family protein [Hyphomonadaceae bacterium]
MSDLRFNSIAGAVLASVLGVMGLGIAAESIVHSSYPEQAGLQPAVAEAPTTGGPAEPAGPPDFGRLFADPAALQELITRGERQIAQCTSCHTFDAGGANRIGPNLHDVFGRAVASHAGFEYSEAMQAHGGAWDYIALNDFLTSPAGAVRGTKMAFAGIRRDEDRVALIAYLRSISPNDVPLPAPLLEAASAEAPASEAGGAP